MPTGCRWYTVSCHHRIRGLLQGAKDIRFDMESSEPQSSYFLYIILLSQINPPDRIRSFKRKTSRAYITPHVGHCSGGYRVRKVCNAG